jgi:hypothetical protein
MESAGFRASRRKIQMTCWISMQEGNHFCNLKMPGVDEQRRKNLHSEGDQIDPAIARRNVRVRSFLR